MLVKKQAIAHSLDSDLKIARRVLDSEILGLKTLSEELDSSFLEAINLISNLKGRVIVSGMGKSGHIARKIAATMSSTGTASLFVHPGEASHGDLGMITKDDVIILLSNSGETSELNAIVNYAKRFSIPIIAIVRNPNSSLAAASDIVLILPAIPEASLIEAPTTSTTMMLALGDALSVVLLERKGFSQEDFHLLHPGGKLGAKFIKVCDIMHVGDKVPLVNKDTLVSEAMITMTEKRLGCAGVIDEHEKLLGIITDGDLRRHMSPQLMNLKAADIMTRNPVTIKGHSLAVEALQVMNQKAITCLFILEDGRATGIIHIHDCLRIGAK